jgi:hypothetical protein
LPPEPAISGMLALFAGHFVVDALDVEVHAENLRIGHMVAVLALDGLSIRVHDRTLNGCSLPEVMAAWVSSAIFFTSSGAPPVCSPPPADGNTNFHTPWAVETNYYMDLGFLPESIRYFEVSCRAGWYGPPTCNLSPGVSNNSGSEQSASAGITVKF